MHVEHRSWTRLGRLVMLAGIGFAGLLSIVGSGGGGGGGEPDPLVVSIGLPTLPRWSARQ
jgi:hypothetical protein